MYTTYRYWLKYGNEDDEVIVMAKEWDSLAAALKYLRRYQSGIRYVSCEIKNEQGITVYEDCAGRGEILYDARGNVVDYDDEIDTFPATTGNKKETNQVKETPSYHMEMVNVGVHKVPRYMCDLYTEWTGGKYVTTGKIYDNKLYNPNFSGCHWSDPRLIYAEQIEGTGVAAGFCELANRVEAVDMDDWYEEEV